MEVVASKDSDISNGFGLAGMESLVVFLESRISTSDFEVHDL